MHSTATRSLNKFLLLPLLGFLFISCLNSSQQEDVRDQLVFNLSFTNINDPVIVENDTLEITSLRFLVGRTTLQNNSGDTLLVVEDAFQISHQRSTSEIKGIAQGTFNSDAVFSSLAFEIKQAEQSDLSGSNIDGDAFIEGQSDDQRYSMIITGSFNGEEFTFKSTRNFNFFFPFDDNSSGNQEGLLYNIPLETDVKDWFRNQQDDSLLDPSNQENAPAINDNIKLSVILS